MQDLQIRLQDHPVLEINRNGSCRILDFDRLPFGLRRKNLSFPDFYEWASGRTISISRMFSKEILNTLRLSQTNRFEVCLACLGLSLQDSYWICAPDEARLWKNVNLFENPLSVVIAGVSLTGEPVFPFASGHAPSPVHTPELTTFGVNAKAWIREKDGLYLYKIGKNELPAGQILTSLSIPHIPYQEAGEKELSAYLTPSRRDWLSGTGEKLVRSRLFTDPDHAFVTFEEFHSFCGYYQKDAFALARQINRTAWLQMQIADFILNNNDRHEQNWGFLMENSSGKILDFGPLFDHDHAFADAAFIPSQTTRDYLSLEDSARTAQKELHLNFEDLLSLKKPEDLTEAKWMQVLERVHVLQSV